MEQYQWKDIQCCQQPGLAEMLSSLALSEHEAHMALLTSALVINLLKVLGNKVT